MNTLKKYSIPIGLFAIFEIIAITLWLSLNNFFYFFNFTYIGGFVSLGTFLSIKKFKYARNIIQIAIGLYMLVYLGLTDKENMQLEGFFYYLFIGVFQAATIHYAVAKIFGPFVFGRGWCGYACQTAMLLDLLPYKQPKEERKKIGYIRYIMFTLSLTFVSSLFIFKVQNLEYIMFISFIVGNILYYICGIILAFIFKDNRAFCKYICPITVFLKPTARFSALKITVNKNKCVSCGKCKKVCPMNIDITDNSKIKQNKSECILCMNCINNCPKNAVKMSFLNKTSK